MMKAAHRVPLLAELTNTWGNPPAAVGELDVLTLYYRDMLEDPRSYFEKILNFYDIPEGLFDFGAVELREKVRFRKGVSGEWVSHFTRGQTNLARDICGDLLELHGWSP